jgi:hypothetical protein
MDSAGWPVCRLVGLPVCRFARLSVCSRHWRDFDYNKSVAIENTSGSTDQTGSTDPTGSTDQRTQRANGLNGPTGLTENPDKGEGNE